VLTKQENYHRRCVYRDQLWWSTW